MFANECLERTYQSIGTVKQIVQEYGDLPMEAYCAQFAAPPVAALQPLDDMLQVVADYTEPLLGADISHRLVEDLASFPTVLTANHHGVDYFSQSVQGSIIFSLNALSNRTTATTVPVLSCASVPLDNLTYPQGSLLYHVADPDLTAMPLKLPVHSNKKRRQLVSVAEPITDEMVRRAEKRVAKMAAQEVVSPSLAATMETIFNEVYRDPNVYQLDDYASQSVVMNHRLWQHLFSDPGTAPDLVYLELEKIAGELLKIDLTAAESLAATVMFDPTVRDRTLANLDGARACWERRKLACRLEVDPRDPGQKHRINGCGTTFFWGMNKSGKKVPLHYNPAGGNGGRLCGVDDRGNTFEMDYSPEAIVDGLGQRRLLPSIFTSFLVISLARGITCAGGYFQGEYLPAMQSGVTRALEQSCGSDKMADKVSAVNTRAYLSGMATSMARYDDAHLIPAGPVELIAGGGITDLDVERMLSVTVTDAHVCALFETLPDVAPPAAAQNNWKKQLAAECARLLNEKVVVK